MKKRLGVALAVISAPLLAAQPRPVSGPTLGWTWDAESAALRPILGIPGASAMGQPLELPLEAARVAISPRGDYALMVAAQGGAASLIRLDQYPLQPEALADASPDADRIVLSPSGSAAALYRSSDGTLQLVRGLPDAPAVTAVPALAGVSALAVSDDGSLALAAVDGALLRITAEGERRSIADLGRISAVQFAPQGHDAAVADRERNQLLLIQDVGGAAQARMLAGSDEGISAPAGVALAADGRYALAANAGSGTVAIVDVASGGATLISCDCAPTTLERLNANAVFRMNEPSGGPLWILDAGAAEPRAWFVPAPVREGSQAQ